LRIPNPVLVMAIVLFLCPCPASAGSIPPHSSAKPVKEAHTAKKGKSTVIASFGWIYLSSCLPETVQFTDSSYTSSAGIVSWSWDFGDGSSSTDQEPLHDFNSNGDYIVTLTVTDDLGFSSSNIQTITISSNSPTVYLGNDTTVCSGTIVTLDAGPQPGCFYYWSTGEMTQQIHVSVTGDYWVQVYNSTCTGMATIHVTVNPALKASFSFTKSATCLPVTVTFNDHSVACNSTIVSWKWDFGDGTTSTLQQPSHDYTTAGNYLARLTIADNNGKKDSTLLTVPISLNSVSVNLGNDTTICGTDSITLNPGTTGDSYLWSNGDTASTITTTQAGMYWVQVTSGSCTGRDSVVLNTTFPLAAGFGNVITGQCLPVDVQFTDSSTVICGAVPITQWSWQFGDGDSSHLQNPHHVYNKKGFFTVQLTIGNSIGMGTVVNHQIEIKNTGPKGQLENDTTICAGGNIQLDAGNIGAVFNWQPAGFFDNPHAQNPFVYPTKTTQFLVDISKCGETIEDSIMIYVDSMVRPVINQTGSVLNASVANGYQWYREGQIIETAVFKNFQPDQPGYYQVEGNNERGCRSISTPYFYLTNGGHNLGGSKIRLKMGPNPAHGTITVWISKIPPHPTKMVLYDVHGKIVYSGMINGNINVIDVSRLNGTYFARFNCGSEELVIPILVL